MVVQVMPYKVLAFGLSDIGLVRQNNEDAWGAVPAIGFFALADGMGGHQAGEIAAREAVVNLCAIIKKSLSRKKKLSLSETQRTIEDAISRVNGMIYDLGCRDDALRGMGTTLCCVQFHERGIIYAHVGDSRIYRLHNRKLSQITTDHSLIRELIDLGQISEGQAPEFLYKNIITKALGTEPNVDPSMSVSDLADQDIYLMCTDGLSDLLSLEEIQDILNHSKSSEKSAKALIEAAKERGGHDNITVVIIRVQELHEEE